MEIVKKEVILINLLKIIINLNKHYSNNNFLINKNLIIDVNNL